MSRSKGKEGERRFALTMANRNYAINDVSLVPDYWSKDIDFIIASPYTGAVKSFEVKWDFHINRTRNLYLEIKNINSK